MGILFTTKELKNGVKQLEGVFFQSEEGKSGIIVKKTEGNKVVFALEIDWEKREVIPCYADHPYDINIDSDGIVNI